MKRTARLIFAWLLIFVLLVACSAAGGSPGASPGDGDDGTIDHPSGDELVFSIENSGGFVMPQFAATQLPVFALTGDGRVFVQGAQIEIFPSPALPPVQARTMTEAGIQAVLAEIGASNLFTGDLELRGAQNFVADASDTVFTLHAAGRDVTVTVYALGFIDPSGGAPQGVTQAEIQAHQVLQRLVDRVTLLDGWLEADAWQDEGWQPYEPEALRLYVRDATGEPVEDVGVPQPIREWPVESDPATFGEEQAMFGDGTRCGVVEGDEAAAWFADLQQANQLSRWSVDGEIVYAVSPRPLLPYEERTCDELAPGA